MKIGVFIIISFLLAPSFGFTQNSINNNKRKVINSDVIANSGITRLGDLFRLIDDWDVTTINGYHWYTSPNGLSPYQQQNWIVMLDDQRMDTYQQL